MLHTNFQAPEPSRSGEADFKVYFIFDHKTPSSLPPDAGPFGLQGHQLNKIGRGLLENASYQMSSPGRFRKDVIDDRRRTVDDGRRTLADGNSSA